MAKDANGSVTGLTLKEAMHLQALEANPLDAVDVAMFEMFERKGWSQAQRIAYIIDHADEAAVTPAAE